MHETLRHVLQQRPLALLFDIDGTLSPIAPTPDEARLYPGVAQLLEQARQYAHIAIVSGRSIPSVARIVNLDGITYIGNHGLEWSAGLPDTHPIEVVAEARPFVEPGKYLLDLVRRELGEIPGLLVEDKSVGGTIHYRLAPDPDEALRRIQDLLTEPARAANMRLVEGKRALEVRVPLAINKGAALRTFCERYAVNGALFAGDDRTDLDAVREIARQRQEGRAAHAIVVRHPDTPPALLEQADSIVDEVEGMAWQLDKIVRALAGN
jgi:trehalose 6-phosphate phosphatase